MRQMRALARATLGVQAAVIVVPPVADAPPEVEVVPPAPLEEGCPPLTSAEQAPSKGATTTLSHPTQAAIRKPISAVLFRSGRATRGLRPGPAFHDQYVEDRTTRDQRLSELGPRNLRDHA